MRVDAEAAPMTRASAAQNRIRCTFLPRVGGVPPTKTEEEQYVLPSCRARQPWSRRLGNLPETGRKFRQAAPATLMLVRSCDKELVVYSGDLKGERSNLLTSGERILWR